MSLPSNETAHTSSDRSLSGLRVVTFESRMAGQLRVMLERLGAIVTSAPAMREVGIKENPAVSAFAESLLSGNFDVVIFLTGVGVRTLFETASQHYDVGSLIKALAGTVTVARGPKVLRALRDLGHEPTISVPEPNTWRELVAAICQHLELSQKRVAIQEYGTTNTELIAALEARGAHVRTVPVYRWSLPENRKPLVEALRALAQGSFDVAIFTSSVQVTHVIQVASAEGIEKELREGLNQMVVGSVGPVCSETLRKYGLTVDVEPLHPKLGHLVNEVARKARLILRTKRASVTGTVEGVFQTPQDKSVTEANPLSQHPILKACRLEPTPYTPVWLMRQAGRYMPEYRKIRERFGFLEMCRRADLAAEITLLAVEKLGVDAAIIFSDLLLPLLPTGVGLKYEMSDGPVIEFPIRSVKDIDRFICSGNVIEELEFTKEAIRLVRQALKGEKPLIGFAGAPFTLASYLIEGKTSRQYLLTKKMMYTQEEAWGRLMTFLAQLTGEYLRAQVAAGADLVQIFDSWVGSLSPDDYRRYILPYTAMAISMVPKGTPVIHFGTSTGNLLELMAEAGGQVIGLDWRVRLDDAWRRLGYKVAIQGNLDPAALLADIPEIRAKVAAVLSQAGGRPGHIFNLGHGILPETPVDHVIALVDAVHEMSARS